MAFNGKRRRRIKMVLQVINILLIIILFLSALSAYIKLKPPWSIPFVPLRMFYQMSLRMQVPILGIITMIYALGMIYKKIQGVHLHKAHIAAIFILICILIMESSNWIEINNTKASMNNFEYSTMSPGNGREDYQLSLKKSYAKELDMTQCEIYQDSSSEYSKVCLIYLNYGGWSVQTDTYGTQIKKFCQDEGYTFIRFAVEREQDEDILALTRNINSRINMLTEKEKCEKVILCGGSAGGHLALLCAGKKSGDQEFLVPEIQVDGVIALYPCVDPGYAYDYYVNSKSKTLASQTKELDEEVFGRRGDKNSMYEATAIQNTMDKKIPILIVHGENDSMMPVEGSEHLYENLSERGYSVSLLKIPGAEHVFDMVSSVAWKRCAKEMTGFIRKVSE